MTRHTITPHLVVPDAARAVDWYTSVLGAEERLRIPVPDGRVMSVELRFGDSTLMLADEFPEMGIVSPQTLGGTYMALHLIVDDVERGLAERARRGRRGVPPAPGQLLGRAPRPGHRPVRAPLGPGPAPARRPARGAASRSPGDVCHGERRCLSANPLSRLPRSEALAVAMQKVEGSSPIRFSHAAATRACVCTIEAAHNPETGPSSWGVLRAALRMRRAAHGLAWAPCPSS